MAKNILEVEIKDEAFKSFVALFEKYQAQLNKMPEQWAKVGKENSKASKSFDKNVNSLSKVNSIQKNITSEQEKFNKTAVNSNRNLQNMAKSAGGIAKSVASTTASLLKWGALGLGAGLLGAGGGLFGMGSLASGASNIRRETKGLGVSAGELKSAEANFTKFFGEGGTAQILDRINEAKSDPNKAGAFRLLGISQDQVNQNSPTDLLNQIIPRLAEKYRTLPQGAEGATYEAMGLGTFADVKTAKQLASYKDQELQDTIKKVQQDAKLYQLTDKQLYNWQKLNITIDSAGQKIKTSFLDSLESLSPKLSDLSDSFSNAISTFLKSDEFKSWIDVASKSLEEFSKYLQSGELKNDVKNWMYMISDIGESLSGLAVVLKPFKLLAPTDKRAGADALMSGDWFEASRKLPAMDFIKSVAGKAMGSSNEELSLRERWKSFNFGNIRALKGEDSYNGFYAPKSEQEGFLKMANQLKLYNSGKSKAAGNRKLETIEDIISTYAPPSENDTKSYIQDVSNRTGFGSKDKLNLNDNQTLSKLMSAMIRHEGKGNYTPDRINKILVSNTAGSDLIVNAAQVAQ